jgi:glycosidase
MREFHISKKSRDLYQFDEAIFSYNGRVIFINFFATRRFAQKINQKRNLANFPERAVKAGQVNAMGLMDEILHHIIHLYQQDVNPDAVQKAYQWLEKEIGKRKLEQTLARFTYDFPPTEVYRGNEKSEEYLKGSSEGTPNKYIALEEMLLLWINNQNKAYAPYMDLFDDEELEKETAYRQVIEGLNEFFEEQPHFGPENQNLIEMLVTPSRRAPYSIFDQLEYIRTHWASYLGKYLYRLLLGMDLIKEEEKISFLGPGEIPVPVYDLAYDLEFERYSTDLEWMPRLVLIAKNIYVWMDQLSKKYQRSITKLNDIPDEELDRLAAWGFNGLWMIGVWERSQASAHIKQLTGNPEAISSAYSLKEYRIADDLGGDDAYRNLRDRAWQRGIRLASDMVPNHMAIDSRWVIEHPDYFVSQNYSPFPSYTFNGPNLSTDSRVGLFIEDHYYNRTDAAVVFKRSDFYTGDERYIYHGNDGTSFPWNDTAQLNYLNPEVREAVIQTIIHVAKQFPIIRFDAAMTLTKRHYQRLWFPEPGSGGDIPSRSDHAMTRGEFNQRMPQEFWREVVDRIAIEVPNTLLLAEAFWLMEGYFVRTLGMHRVYNSAFMNMLRDEDNAKYRAVMKNTLEFDPEILKRFVNFMNNPDERTSVDQFGKGDKYFGICTMMATLPGLPMFGHGQIEGFTEKYGMEYKRSYWDEPVDDYLVERHQREIFPLLHRRALFAEVENFLLYDFFNPDGFVNEDVFAYSNYHNGQRGLVVYHNKFKETAGWVRISTGFSVKVGEERQIQQRTLFDGLKLSGDENTYVVFCDHVSQLEYIRSNKELREKGLFLMLGAYKYQVFLDFYEVIDDSQGSYRQIHDYLNGHGVPSIDEAKKELLLRPVQEPFRQIANRGYFDYLLEREVKESEDEANKALLDAVQKLKNLFDGIGYTFRFDRNQEAILEDLGCELQTVLSVEKLIDSFPEIKTRNFRKALKQIKSSLHVNHSQRMAVLLAWVFTHNLGKLAGEEDWREISYTWLNEWQFNKILEGVFREFTAADDFQVTKMVNMLNILTGEGNLEEEIKQKHLREILEERLSNPLLQRYLGVNRYQGTLWYNKEAFEEYLWWLTAINVIEILSHEVQQARQVKRVAAIYKIIKKLEEADKISSYQVEKLLDATCE